MFAGGNHLMFKMASALRKQPTHAEDLLWTYLSKKPLGYKFRRQHVYAVYVLDFYCHALKLLIEVDGSIHDLEEVQKTDKHRQEELENCGLTILRFTNDKVKLKMNEVQQEIETYILNSSNGKEKTPRPKSPLQGDRGITNSPFSL